jgi:type III pantothenate kinase
MNLVVDYGNSRIKAALFDQDKLSELLSFTTVEELKNFLSRSVFRHALVSSVAGDAALVTSWINVQEKKMVLAHDLPLPITIKYKTPHTLGMDRVAAACGAIEVMPHRDCLVIDIGSCINYEFIDSEKVYHGGSISPGVSMRFEAMHTFTARLPLVKATSSVNLIGDSTEACMQSGVMLGVLSEMEGIIQRYLEKYPNMGVILCGGDGFFFENNLKPPIFVAPNLVLSGLNRILRHNVNF